MTEHPSGRGVYIPLPAGAAVPTAPALPAHLAQRARLLWRYAYGRILATVPTRPLVETQADIIGELAGGGLSPHAAGSLWLIASTYCPTETPA